MNLSYADADNTVSATKGTGRQPSGAAPVCCHVLGEEFDGAGNLVYTTGRFLANPREMVAIHRIPVIKAPDANGLETRSSGPDANGLSVIWHCYTRQAQ